MARRARGSGSVYKDKDGYWNGQIIVGRKDGKPQYKRFRCKKQGDVIDKMNAYKLSVGQSSADMIEQTTIATLLTTYTALKKQSLRPASYDSLVVTQNLIMGKIGNCLITDLSPEIIQRELITPLCDTHAYSTIHKVYILLNECMEFAIDKNYLVRNPCRQVKMPKQQNFDKKDIRILTEEEISSFKETATSQRKTMPMPKYQYGLIITLIIYTGLRVGELCALQWKDIDWNNRKMIISKSVGVVYENKKRKLVVQNTTKSGKIRYVPLNDKAIDILTKQKEFIGGDKTDYIVNGSSAIVDKTVVANTYPKICKAAGIENPNGIHSLRHTFASLALRKGVDIKVISDILGHASVNFTYNSYVHIIDEQKINAVDLLNNI